MTLEALQHLLRSARALAEDRELVVLGSSSLLIPFPELGEDPSFLAATYDADLLPVPFDELTGTMLEEALGEERAYYQRHGYHADILRDSIRSTLPDGWKERLLPVPACPYARSLAPSDLAATKLWVGRPKDLSLIQKLAETQRLDGSTVAERIRQLPVAVEALPPILARHRQIFEAPDVR